MCPFFHIIVAHDQNLGIGIRNQIPWHLPVDLRYFKFVTSDAPDGYQNAVIMGRKTWESIPKSFRPLPGRVNIVLSRTLAKLDGAIVMPSLDEALHHCKESQNIQTPFVIGGSQIYEHALNHQACHQLYITKVFRSVNCDAYFPSYYDQFTCMYASNIWVTQNGNCAFYKFEKIEK